MKSAEGYRQDPACNGVYIFILNQNIMQWGTVILRLLDEESPRVVWLRVKKSGGRMFKGRASPLNR